MATRTITIKDAYVAEMIEVFGHDYQTDIQDPAEAEGVTMPNPQTKANYAGKQLDRGVKGYIKLRVQSYRKKIAPPINEVEIIEDIV